jgi:hypothetical protein
MTNSHVTKRWSRAAIAAVIAAAAGGLVVAGISQAQAEQSGASWSFHLDEPGPDSANVTRTTGVTTIRDTTVQRAAVGDGRGFGTDVSASHELPAATDRVVVRSDATVPAGTSLTTEIRGRTAAGRWTEWSTVAGNGTTVLPDAVSAVQVRVDFLTDAHQTSPALRSVTVAAAGAVSTRTQARAPQAMAATGRSYRVYATREGLVGGTTANGHIIASKDHFVALPSARVLNPQGRTDYSVQICYGRSGRCVVAPIWDIGPWNEHDDYWNASAQRERFNDLPQGKPEAQAAYQDGYNGGRDGLGRAVGNPAGIDLADGTFADVGLTDNDWVDVTYLWTGSSTAPVTTTDRLFGLSPDRAHVSVYSGAGVGPGAWSAIGGVATRLYAGGAGLFATNPNDGSVSKYNGDGTWTRIGGPADSFAVTGNGLYGLSSDKGAVSVWNGTPGSWTVIGGAATRIYGGGAGLFATNPNDGSVSKYNGAPGSWTRIGGPADSFAVTGNGLYGLSSNKAAVSVWNGTPGSWTVIGGVATRLYGGGAGLFATNPNDGSISKYNGTPGSWTRIGGPGNSFAVGSTRLYGLAPDKSSVAVWSGNGTGWLGIGGPADSIAAN